MFKKEETLQGISENLVKIDNLEIVLLRLTRENMQWRNYSPSEKINV